MKISIHDLFEDSRIQTVKSSGCKEYIGTTLSMNNAVSKDTLIKYSKDNFCHARAVINDLFVYVYNGLEIDVNYD